MIFVSRGQIFFFHSCYGDVFLDEVELMGLSLDLFLILSVCLPFFPWLYFGVQIQSLHFGGGALITTIVAFLTLKLSW